MNTDSELVRLLALIITAPWWWRLLRLLWRDFNGALREEGGLLGSPPTPSQLAEMRRERAAEPDMLVSEPWARPQDRRQPRLKTPSPTRTGAPAAGRAAPPPAGRRAGERPRGFR